MSEEIRFEPTPETEPLYCRVCPVLKIGVPRALSVSTPFQVTMLPAGSLAKFVGTRPLALRMFRQKNEATKKS